MHPHRCTMHTLECNKKIRVAAEHVLISLAKHHGDAMLADVVALISDANASVRKHAMRVLVRYGRKKYGAQPHFKRSAVIKLLESDNQADQLGMLMVLRRFGARAGDYSDTVLKLLSSEKARVRVCASATKVLLGRREP